MKKLVFIASSLYLLPFFALAAAPELAAMGGGSPNSLLHIIDTAGVILNKLIPLLIAITVVVFFWGLIRYVSTSGKDQAYARNTMIAGITGLFIMVSIWGILRLVQSTLGVGGAPKIDAPQVYSPY